MTAAARPIAGNPVLDELRELLSPAARARVERYAVERSAIERKHGAWFGALWASAQRFIEHGGRVRPPPARWDFVPIAASRAGGNPGEYPPEQIAQARDFWSWYLAVEWNLTELIRCIRELHRVRAEHEELFQAVCAVGCAIYDQYSHWIREKRIEWLPRNRGGDPEKNIVMRLGDALNQCVSGPPKDDGDPGPEWEPMP